MSRSVIAIGALSILCVFLSPLATQVYAVTEQAPPQLTAQELVSVSQAIHTLTNSDLNNPTSEGGALAKVQKTSDKILLKVEKNLQGDHKAKAIKLLQKLDRWLNGGDNGKGGKLNSTGQAKVAGLIDAAITALQQ